MNSLLQVKLGFTSYKNAQTPNGRNLKKGKKVTLEKIDDLIESLRAVMRFYKEVPKYIKNILIDVNYDDIIAKSNRVQELLKPDGININDTIVGARFSNAPEGEENHIITHYVDEKTVLKAIEELSLARVFLLNNFDGIATPDNFNSDEINESIYKQCGLSKTRMRNVIVDCSVVDVFSIPAIVPIEKKDSYLITLYKTELSVSLLFEKLKLDSFYYRYDLYGENTIAVSGDLFELLKDKVPYMISMISGDLSKVSPSNFKQLLPKMNENIPNPGTEPVIGVIDTLFDESVYFSKWVENEDCLDDIERISLQPDANRIHGTEVCSLIVDGPRLNPWLDDGCGRFRVRHFGVCENKVSVPKLVGKIKNIIERNPDIHVWNLSLGTEEEVSKNFISFDASVLDEIQAKKNVIFVIAGTNDNRKEKLGALRVGSPADSLNSLVINAVNRSGQPASYSRKGTVLSFFNKPDVSYYGGDYDDRIKVYASNGVNYEYGTSFAAPWISRKLCYLIDIMGLPREVAKALIIDSAAKWEYKISTYKTREFLGYGVVPISIYEILQSPSEEIKFLVYGTSESFKTANYAIPVPRDKDNKYPYIARAVMCYFPKCSRLQGVDYTDRELSFKFGRIKPDGSIDDINDNTQDDIGSYVDERKSRKEFRKWENTKFISKIMKRNKPIKSYDERLWGLEVVSKERLSSKMEEGLNFGAVITLREVNKENRISDFIHACNMRGWIVSELNITNRLAIYNSNQEEILLD